MPSGVFSRGEDSEAVRAFRANAHTSQKRDVWGTRYFVIP